MKTTIDTNQDQTTGLSVNRLYISELPHCLMLVNDSQDVKSLLSFFDGECLDEIKRYDSYFVGIVDGEYAEVWGFHGIIPGIDKMAYRVYRKIFNQL